MKVYPQNFLPNGPVSLSARDRTILRDLAKQVAEIASLPVMEERRRRWTRHNQLEAGRPMIVVFPESGWPELLSASELKCENELLKRSSVDEAIDYACPINAIEWYLRSRIYQHEHIHDDSVIEKDFFVYKNVRNTGWGLQPKRVESVARPFSEGGSWGFDPVIKTADDLKELRFPEVVYAAAATAVNIEFFQDLFGDVLNVVSKGVSMLGFGPMALYCMFRGLEQAMLDTIENPGMLHEAMTFLCEGHRRLIVQLDEMNLLSLNNDCTYTGSGGFGYSSELPPPDFDPAHVRPRDMWGGAASQEFTLVSPEATNEFVYAYEKPLLEQFGLASYGCCEDMSRKVDYLKSLKNLRRISVSPFADLEKSAQVIGGDYVFSCKAHPAYLVGKFNPEKVRAYLARILEVTRGCVLEIILKDTHTCEHHPERFTQWTDVAQEVVSEMTGQ